MSRIIRRRQPLSGEALKIIGMNRAEAAVPDWNAEARHLVYHVLAPSGVEFDSEAVTNKIGLPRKKPGQHRNNAVGPLFASASHRGIIYRTGFTKAERPRSHANVHSTWRGTGTEFVSKKPCPFCDGWI